MHFDFPDELWKYFQQVDTRFVRRAAPQATPAPVACYTTELSGIRAVLWDVYGTLFGVGSGDLAASFNDEDGLTSAAAATVAEFHLAASLEQLYPALPPAQALRDWYLQLIAASHSASEARGVTYPEVLIERIWQSILQQCCEAGYELAYAEPILHTAYRCAYFFDSSLQKTYLNTHAASCLRALVDNSVTQGIISNAQFYTPLHLRRLLRRAWDRQDLQLEDVFAVELTFYSYVLGLSKPNPESFARAQAALRSQGIGPQETLYVGNDMLNDIFGAREVGWGTILYAGDERQTQLHRDDPRCRNLEPDAIVNDLGQIAELICHS